MLEQKIFKYIQQQNKSGVFPNTYRIIAVFQKQGFSIEDISASMVRLKNRKAVTREHLNTGYEAR